MLLTAESGNFEPILDLTLKPGALLPNKGLASDEARKEMDAKNNRLQIGIPQVIDLQKLAAAPGEKAFDFTAFNADFRLVRLACGFLPDKGCRYVWARLSIDLVGLGDNQNEQVIAFDMFPLNVERQTTVKRGYEIAPTLKLSFGEAALKASRSDETIVYEPQLSGAGLLTSQPSWTFKSNDRDGLLGSRELFLVVKLPKGKRCGARFGIAAESQGRFGPIPLRRVGEVGAPRDLIELKPE
ncbi:hypothetical protein [Bradyrhizobium diazoefficiens]|uniref:Uncharacterized protein n=1 Tax=Bradyrhizobium diazoefficiens TaxID=1355477 RepID=A0A810C6D2_9BRAD|nr:hypothetical protein XF9B_52150 [Bradyrhizobium diazoefficiens]BCF01306.1 hypothetical protein XF11B_53260 [Bradyrhizobium diazoefficiens]BCF09879.1 hypothetical protein XF12B_52520 [Bradyrhizobium diazoefficiens]BCF62341.1 hypothetical protein XF18B_52890 [Bradyrhizobium diazoefficiens]